MDRIIKNKVEVKAKVEGKGKVTNREIDV